MNHNFTKIIFNKCSFLSLNLERDALTFVSSINDDRKSKPMALHRTSSIYLRRLVCLASALVLLGLGGLRAQGWEYFFGGPNEDFGQAVIQTKDQGYLAVGFSESFTTNLGAYAVRTDVDGTEIWSEAYADGFIVHGYSVVETASNSYFIVGDIILSGVPPLVPNVYLLEIDDKGEKLGAKQYGGAGNDIGRKIVATPASGGYLIVGSTNSIGNGEDDVYLIKIDEEANQVWAKPFGTPGDDVGRGAVETTDGYLVIGTALNPDNNQKGIYLLKVDFLGNEMWSKFLGTDEFDEGYDIVAMPDGNFGIVGNVGNQSDVYLAKIDADGNEIWATTFGGSLSDQAYDLELADNGDLVFCGITEIDEDNADSYIARYTPDGEEVWFSLLGRSTHFDLAQSIAPCADGGFIATGFNSLYLTLVNDLSLIKANASGSVFTNQIIGKVIIDEDEQCDLDAGEPGLREWIVKAESETNTFFGTSDANGNYWITVDSGDYALSVFVKNDYWQSCIGTYNVSFGAQYDTLFRHFPMQKVVDCPLLEVDISTPVVQNCSNMAYSVSYCNTGTVGEAEPSVHVILDNDLAIVSSPLPYSVVDSLVIFELDSIGLDTCGSFFFVAESDCDGQPNEAYFATAHIFPDSICIEPMNWDNASVDVDGYCEPDSVRFIISNDGTGDMNEVQRFIIIEDHVMSFEGPQEFQLQVQQSTTITKEADGTTYRIIAEQSPGHPGNSYPTVAVEGCTTGSTFSTGFTTELQEDENDPSISIDVQEAISSTTDYIFLRGYPKGYLENGENLIPANTPLEYHIYFENSGTDTIQRLVIRDTLPTSLELGTVVPGASSHPYEFEAYSNGVLKFTFDNLALSPADGGTASSIGFVKFKVSQKPNNPAGTEIPNSAAVFLGFDAPVQTVRYTHVVDGMNTFDFFLTDVEEANVPGIKINSFPNPFTTSIMFEAEGRTFQEISVTVFNLSGQLVRREKVSGNQLQLSRGSLLAGLYTYRLEGDGLLLNTGKIIVR